jgi:hypothetical protein
MNADRSQNIIDLLIVHEEAVSRLYDSYASHFEDQRGFWAALAQDELKHAEQIRQLASGIEKGIIIHDRAKLNSSAVKLSIDHVNSKYEQVKSKEITFINALSVALSIEKSIIDGGFFDSFKGISKNAKQLVQDLKQGVEEHYNRIDKMWRENRKFA